MRLCVRSLLVPALACLVVSGTGLLGYTSYNNGYIRGYQYGYSLGYDSGYSQNKEFDTGYRLGYHYGSRYAKAEYNRGYSLGYEYGGRQAEAKFNEGYNCGYQIAYEEASVPGDSVGSSSHEIVLKNPSFKELRDFILNDTTSRNKFLLNQYECRHFATEVVNNAEAGGLRAAFVLLGYDRGQHAVVAFDTTDRGLVYIEPQTDAAIHPEVGGNYQGKEIKEILIAW